MPGFLAAVGDAVGSEWLPLRYWSLRPLVTGQLAGTGYAVHRFVNPKFLEDKVFGEDADLVLAMDGVIHNLQDLRRTFGCESPFMVLKRLYEREGDRLPIALRGTFSGFLYDKARRKALVFTGQTGCKPVYYHAGNGLFLFASELKVLSTLLRRLNRPPTLDTLGAYFLLTYGYMLEDYTLLKEVRKLQAGHLLVVSDGGLEVRCYHRLENNPLVSDSLNGIIDTLDRLFREAVRREFEKDVSYGYRHIATLSGGMDTRVTNMVARDLGYSGILNMTFAQSGCWDEKIARQVAADLGNESIFYALDDGTFAVGALEAAVKANDGMVIWIGSAHEFAMCRKLSFDDYGMLHTGQLGEAIFGNYLSGPEMRKPSVETGAMSTRLLDRVRPDVAHILGRYESDDLFLLYSQEFNGNVNSTWMTYQFTEVGSPFSDPDLLEYVLRVPCALRHRLFLYQQWVLAKYPRAASYFWHRIKARVADGRLKRFCKEARWFATRKLSRFSRRPGCWEMNPFHYWYKTSREFQGLFRGYFDRNAWVLDGEPELKRDCKALFEEGRVGEKCQVMTLLEGIKLHLHDGA